MLLGCARRLFLRYQNRFSPDAELTFISDLTLAGANNHAQGRSGATTLDHYLCTGWIGDKAEVNKEILLLTWMSCLRRCGMDLQQYWRNEEDLHGNGRIAAIDRIRRNIDRVFQVYYGASRSDVSLLVGDVWRKPGDLDHLPGKWDPDAEYVGQSNLSLIEGLSLSAFRSVATSGFQDDDYSPERASYLRVFTI